METVEYIVVGVVDKPKPVEAVKPDDVDDILKAVAEVEKEQPVKKVSKPKKPAKPAGRPRKH